MNFIDYNFFPILFFLGWNILTTKQFRPTISHTSDSKTLPALSVFSLKGLPLMDLKGGPITNSMNQKTLESNSKNYQKESNILEFVPKFLFLSENQKLIGIPQANIICWEKQTKDTYVLKKTFLKHKISTICKHKAENVNYVAKTSKWLPNKDSTHYFSNHNLVNHKWKENFKPRRGGFFHFTYRPKRKRFLSSFFAYNEKIKPVCPTMKSWLNLRSRFSNLPLQVDSSELIKSNQFKNGLFFGGLCYFENNTSFWKKAQTKLNFTGPKANQGSFSKTTGFFKRPFRLKTVFKRDTSNVFGFKNQTKNVNRDTSREPVFKKDAYQNQIPSTKTQEAIKKNGYDYSTCILENSSFLESSNMPSFLVDTKKERGHLLNSLKGGYFNSIITRFWLKNKRASSAGVTYMDKLNHLNSIQKRRLKIRILLRAPSQKIYSLNQFQMALCFSKILQPPIFFQSNYRFNLELWFSNKFENKDGSRFKISSSSGFPKLNDLNFNYVKNEFQPQTMISKGEFLQNRFANSDRETGYIDKYKQKKTNWYMKTQFFQHLAWNMKYKILNRFSDVEYLLSTTSHDFTTKPFQLVSYQNTEHFPTNSNKSLKIGKDKLSGHQTRSMAVKILPFPNETKNNGTSMNYENKKSIWLNDFSAKSQKNLKAHTFCQNYFLSIYGGSWYYENLAFPYSIFNTIALNPSVNRQSEPVSILNGWYNTFFKEVTKYQTSVMGKEKLLESKRFALAWFYARKYHVLQNFRYWPYLNKCEYNDALFDKNQPQFELLPRENKFAWNSILLPENQHLDFKDFKMEPRPSFTHRGPTRIVNNSYNYKKNPFLAKSQTKLESDIGIYSLAHKLSSVGFRNGNSEIEIYPFKYNDSYGYNFQNMNLSNQRFRNFLGLSSENNQTRNAPLSSRENTDIEPVDFKETTGFSNYKKFLDFQNPIFSKTYAPLYQPKGLNLLSFIANSFLNIIPNSMINSQPITFFGKNTKTTNFSLPNKTQPIINQSLYDFKKSDRPLTTIGFNENLHITSKKESFRESSLRGSANAKPRTRWYGQQAGKEKHQGSHSPLFPGKAMGWKIVRLLNDLYEKLPINGIHANPYPWITQNAFDRWSASNYLWTLGSNSWFLPSFSETESDSLKINNPLKKKFELTTNLNDSYKKPFFFNTRLLKDPPLANENTYPSKTSVNRRSFMASQKESLKNFNSQLHFTEKLSCVKKPFIFFSSFRHLPYFFISETLSKKNVIFPQANLSLFPLGNSSNYQLEKPTKNAYSDLSIPQYYLFQNTILKKNQGRFRGKKSTVEPSLSSLLQHKYFSLKPLSTFIKKDIGYHTSLFSWIPQTKTVCSENQTNNTSRLKKPGSLSPKSDNKLSNTVGSHLKIEVPNQKILKFWSRDATPKNKEKSISKIDLMPIKKNTWQIFPPLFQPLSFRFSDFNFPRTWSSELITPVFNSKPLKIKNSQFSNTLENIEMKKKPSGSNSTSSLNLKKQTGPKILPQTIKWNMTQKNFFGFSIPFYYSDFFRFSINENNPSNKKSALVINNNKNHENKRFYESAFPLTDFFGIDEDKQLRNNPKFEKKNEGSARNQTVKFQNSKIMVYAEKPLLKNRTAHGPPLKNQKESISLPNYLKNITNQNYQNLSLNNLNEFYFVFWILFNKTLFIYLSLHYLRKFISFLGIEYTRNLFKIFVTTKFIDGNILSSASRN